MSAAAPLAPPTAASDGGGGSYASTAASSESPLFLQIHGKLVPVTAVSSVPRAAALAALASAPVQSWAAAMSPEITVTSVQLQSIDFFGSRVGFVKFSAAAMLAGRPVPGIVFCRGGAVAILVVLRCGARRVALCCRQPRLPIGAASFLEIPAGMLDGSGSFAGVAAKEMAEETGIVVSEAELLDLTALAYGAAVPGVYPSAGGCDEFLRLMLYSKAVGEAELSALQGKLTGSAEESEFITLDLVELDDLWRLAPDGKTLAALLLYEKLRARGAIAD